MLASSCSQLEVIGGSLSIPEIHVRPSTPSRRDPASLSSTNPSSSSAVNHPGARRGKVPLHMQPLSLRQQEGRRGEQDGSGERRGSDGLLPLIRSHSEPGLSSSTDTGKVFSVSLHTCVCVPNTVKLTPLPFPPPGDFTGSVGSKGISDRGSQTSTDTGDWRSRDHQSVLFNPGPQHQIREICIMYYVNSLSPSLSPVRSRPIF